MDRSNEALQNLRAAYGSSGGRERSRDGRRYPTSTSRHDRSPSPRSYHRAPSPPSRRRSSRDRSPRRHHSRSPARSHDRSHDRSRDRSPWRRKTSPNRLYGSPSRGSSRSRSRSPLRSSKGKHGRSRSRSSERSPRRSSTEASSIIDPNRMRDICDHIESGEASSKTVHLLAELGHILREKEKLKAELEQTSSGASAPPPPSRSKSATASVPPWLTEYPTTNPSTYDYQQSSSHEGNRGESSSLSSQSTGWPQSASSSSASHHASWPQSKPSTYEQSSYPSHQASLQSSYDAQSYGTNWPATSYDERSLSSNTSSTYTDYSQTAQSTFSNPPHTGHARSQRATDYSHNAPVVSTGHTIPGIARTPPHKPEAASELTPTQKSLLTEWEMIGDTTSSRKLELDDVSTQDSTFSSTSSGKEDAPGCFLYLQGLDKLNKMDLLLYFSKYGQIKNVEVEEEGQGHIEFDNMEQVKKAFADGLELGHSGLSCHSIKDIMFMCNTTKTFQVAGTPYELQVSGLRADITEQDLHDYFSMVGTLIQVTIMPGGVGIIEFKSADHVDVAVNAGKYTGERGVTTHWIKGKEVSCRSKCPKHCLLLSRLKTLTEQQLKQYFSKYGKVDNVTILQRMGPQGITHGGFVSFKSRNAVQSAYEEGLKWEKSEHHIKTNCVEVFSHVQELNPCRLFVKDADKVSDMDIALYFSKYGAMKDCKIANGCGYLEFSSPEHVEAAYKDGLTAKSHHCVEQIVIDCRPYLKDIAETPVTPARHGESPLTLSRHEPPAKVVAPPARHEPPAKAVAPPARHEPPAKAMAPKRTHARHEPPAKVVAPALTPVRQEPLAEAVASKRHEPPTRAVAPKPVAPKRATKFSSISAKTNTWLYIGGMRGGEEGKQIMDYFKQYGVTDFKPDNELCYGNLDFETGSGAEEAYMAGEPMPRDETRRCHMFDFGLVWLGKKKKSKPQEHIDLHHDVDKRSLITEAVYSYRYRQRDIQVTKKKIQYHFSQFGIFNKVDGDYKWTKPLFTVQYSNVGEAQNAFAAGEVSSCGTISKHEIGQSGVVFIRYKGTEVGKSGRQDISDFARELDSTGAVRKRQRSPESPRRRSSLPRRSRSSRSPKRVSSPSRRDSSPRRRTASPKRRRSRSPRRRSRSPRSRSPRRRSRSPRRRSRSPKRRSRSPQSQASRKKSLSPPKKAESPPPPKISRPPVSLKFGVKKIEQKDTEAQADQSKPTTKSPAPPQSDTETKEALDASLEKVGSNKWKCKVCIVECNSQWSWNMHVNSKAHKRCVAADNQKSKQPVQVKTPTTRPTPSLEKMEMKKQQLYKKCNNSFSGKVSSQKAPKKSQASASTSAKTPSPKTVTKPSPKQGQTIASLTASTYQQSIAAAAAVSSKFQSTPPASSTYASQPAASGTYGTPQNTSQPFQAQPTFPYQAQPAATGPYQSQPPAFGSYHTSPPAPGMYPQAPPGIGPYQTPVPPPVPIPPPAPVPFGGYQAPPVAPAPYMPPPVPVPPPAPVSFQSAPRPYHQAQPSATATFQSQPAAPGANQSQTPATGMQQIEPMPPGASSSVKKQPQALSITEKEPSPPGTSSPTEEDPPPPGTDSPTPTLTKASEPGTAKPKKPLPGILSEEQRDDDFVKLFVYDILNPLMKWHDLDKYFRKFGKIKFVKMCPKNNAAFVKFYSRDDAMKAFNGGRVMGTTSLHSINNTMMVNTMLMMADQPANESQEQDDEESRKLFLGSVSHCTWEDLALHFKKYGYIQQIDLPTNLGTGYLYFTSRAAAERAFDLGNKYGVEGHRTHNVASSDIVVKYKRKPGIAADDDTSFADDDNTQPPTPKTLYLINAHKYPHEELVSYFSRFGTVEKLDLPPDYRGQGICGYLHYKLAASAKRAYLAGAIDHVGKTECRIHKINPGRPAVRVRYWTDKANQGKDDKQASIAKASTEASTTPGSEVQQEESKETRKLVVYNNPGFSLEVLQQYFCKFGIIQEINFAKQGKLAFVLFKSAAYTRAAFLAGSKVKGGERKHHLGSCFVNVAYMHGSGTPKDGKQQQVQCTKEPTPQPTQQQSTTAAAEAGSKQQQQRSLAAAVAGNKQEDKQSATAAVANQKEDSASATAVADIKQEVHEQAGPSTSIKGQSTTLVLGDAISFNEGKTSAKLPDGDTVIWDAVDGARIPNMCERIATYVQQGVCPTTIVIALGAFDINNDKANTIEHNMIKELTAVRNLLPNAQIIWSDILPRMKYSGIGKWRATTVNRCAHEELGKMSNSHTIKTAYLFNSERPKLFQDDIRLSEKGQSVYKQHIIDAMRFFSVCESEFQFPSKNAGISTTLVLGDAVSFNVGKPISLLADGGTVIWDAVDGAQISNLCDRITAYVTEGVHLSTVVIAVGAYDILSASVHLNQSYIGPVLIKQLSALTSMLPTTHLIWSNILPMRKDENEEKSGAREKTTEDVNSRAERALNKISNAHLIKMSQLFNPVQTELFADDLHLSDAGQLVFEQHVLDALSFFNHSPSKFLFYTGAKGMATPDLSNPIESTTLVLGDAVSFNVGKPRTQLADGGTVVWDAVDGSRISSLCDRIIAHIQQGVHPTAVVIALGTYDIFSERLGVTLLRWREEFAAVRNLLLPTAHLIWSDILPRKKYENEDRTGVGNRTLKELNRGAQKEFQKMSNAHLIESSHLFNLTHSDDLFEDDIHISDKGQSVFEQHVLDALSFFNHSPTEFHYPHRDAKEGSLSGASHSNESTVLVLGDGVSFHAGKPRSQLADGGTVVWDAVEGSRISNLCDRIIAYMIEGVHPRTVVIAVGANDIFSESLGRIRHVLIEELTALRCLLPTTRLIWSKILPRLKFENEERPGAGKNISIEIGKIAQKELQQISNTHVINTSHFFNPAHSDLFEEDTIHLSEKGQSVFEQHVLDALSFFNHSPTKSHFPQRDAENSSEGMTTSTVSNSIEKILVLGDGISFHAGKPRTQLADGGTVVWDAVEGSRISDLCDRITAYLEHDVHLRAVVIALGAYDIFSESLGHIRYALIEKLTAVRSLLPTAQLIWSKILPRQKYENENRPGAGKNISIGIDKIAQKEIQKLSNTHIIKTSKVFHPTHSDLFEDDTMHLSEKGQAVFEQHVLDALSFFSHSPTEFQFPQRNAPDEGSEEMTTSGLGDSIRSTTLVLGDAVSFNVGKPRTKLADGSTVTWDAVEGSQVSSLCDRITPYMKLGVHPKAVVIALGAYDIFSEALASVHPRLRVEFTSVRNLLPNAWLIWSNVLPRRKYENEERPGAGKRTTLDINKSARKELRKIANTHEIHTSHIFHPDRADLFADDIHLSDEGQSVYEQHVLDALSVFNTSPATFCFPESPKTDPASNSKQALKQSLEVKGFRVRKKKRTR